MGVREDKNMKDYYDGADCLDAMMECYGEEAVKNFCLCNAFKYLWRCMKKHETPIEDVKKANDYLLFYLGIEDGK